MKGKLFPLATPFSVYHPHPDYRVRAIGEFRPPRMGEWFLSGAIIEGHRANQDLTTPYHIGKVVRVKQITIIKEIVEEEVGL